MDGKPFDKANSNDGSADKLADKIQVTRANIGSNALSAIQPGNPPKDIQKYEHDFDDVEGGGMEVVERIHFEDGKVKFQQW